MRTRKATGTQSVLSSREGTASPSKPAKDDPDRYVDIDLSSVESYDSRTVGAESVALHAAQTLQLPEILKDVGFSQTQVAMALASIVGRLVEPGDEDHTWYWIIDRSAIGELVGMDFSRKTVMGLDRASELLLRNQKKIEAALSARMRTLFSPDETIALYDLTYTYFEGEVKKHSKIARTYYKERREDARLLTLMVDGSGFVRKSGSFAGSTLDVHAVQAMLGKLKAPEKALVVLDRHTESREILDWLVSRNYHYVVLSRENIRMSDADKGRTIRTARDQELKIFSELNEEQTERHLYCYSPGRAAKDDGNTERFIQKFEEDLLRLNEGLSKPRAENRKDRVLERIARLTEINRGISQHYSITVSDNAATKDPDKPLLATAVHFEKKPVQGSIVVFPGVSCFRTSAVGLDDEALWRIHTLLTDLDAVFRSVEPERNPYDTYDPIEYRSRGHQVITMLACMCLQVIYSRLREQGVHDSWPKLREPLIHHWRMSTSYRLRNGGSVHVRKSVRPTERQQRIYRCPESGSQSGRCPAKQLSSKNRKIVKIRRSA